VKSPEYGKLKKAFMTIGENRKIFKKTGFKKFLPLILKGG
jgi:hypothetical protein